MNDGCDDPELEEVFAAQVGRGQFATMEKARAAFFVKLDRSIADSKAGRLTDAEAVFARLQERYASWPRAAE